MKPAGISKGVAVTHLLQRLKEFVLTQDDFASPAALSQSEEDKEKNSLFPFVLCMGDDRADEEMFRSIARLTAVWYDDSRGSKDSQQRHRRHESLNFDGDLAPTSSFREVMNDHLLRKRTARASAALESMTPAERADMAAMSPEVFTMCVGIRPSCARGYVHDFEDAIEILQQLVQVTKMDRLNQQRKHAHESKEKKKKNR